MRKAGDQNSPRQKRGGSPRFGRKGGSVLFLGKKKKKKGGGGEGERENRRAIERKRERETYFHLN